MLSAIILCPDRGTAPSASLEAVVRTLAPLVGACIAGLVHDVAIAGPAGADLAAIADHAGCAFIEGADEAEWLGRAAAAARRPNLLLLRAGFVPQPGFIEEIEDLAPLLPTTMLVMRAAPNTFAERLVLRLAPVVALVVPAASCRTTPNFATLARRRVARRLLRAVGRPAVDAGGRGAR